MITAPDEVKLNKTLEKVWGALTFLNDHTDGGFFKLRQVFDNAKLKRASYYKYINGQKIEDGFMSQIEGIVADKPSKVRGDRAELVIFEEAGSNPNLQTSYVQGEALVNVGGNKLGILLSGGTGGDSGANLAGLKDMYYNPDVYDVLKFKHSMNDTHECVYTGFFVPSYKALDVPELVDSRGVCFIEKCKEHYNKERAKRSVSPQALIKYCAEYCFTAEEAFALEGENKFNKVLLAEQLTQIRALKMCPTIDKGYFSFVFNNKNSHKLEGGNVTDVVWHSDSKKPIIQILEHPMWTETYKIQEQDRREQEDDENGQPTIIPKQNALYVIGVDGIDIGQSQTSEFTKDPSSFCAIVMKRVYGMQDPQIVAVYKDRPQDLRECYQMTIALAMYYNCLINIEATRMSFVTWAKSNKLLNYFMRRPKATYPDITKQKSTQYGSPATIMVIDHQTDLIRDFIEDYSYNIWFEDLLQELISYNDENKRKFDMVAAFGMVMLADEELNGITPRAVKSEEDTFEHFGYYVDENGYKRFGAIPSNTNLNTQLIYNSSYNDDDYTRIRSSDPRAYSFYL